MAIRYTREYDKILDDLSKALTAIPDCYETFEMTKGEWEELEQPERDVCLRTLADDLFYVLGSSPASSAGSGKVEYDKAHHVIKVIVSPQLTHLVPLKEQ
ncbi:MULTISPECIES: hypothetical protein [Cohnella]|uniref:hypothetical protein n=1 Tax=Cohnella TaxID=329857 RepID=UPI0009BBD6EC|nr:MULTISPECIES: hypothetical protein [Cohnella]MBN2981916.1 hypothetical protein [Cohnella algarum]